MRDGRKFALAILLATSLHASPIAITSDGALVIASNPDSASVTLIQAASRRVLAEIPIGGTPESVAIDAKYAYVVTGEGRIVTLDLDTRSVLSSADLACGCFGIVADNGRLFISDTANARLLVVDAESLHIVDTIPTEPRPRGMALDRGKLYVTHFDTGRVSVIDTARRAVDRVIATASDGNLAQGIVVAGGRLYLPMTRFNVTNAELLFDSTLFPIVEAVDLASLQSVPAERIAIDIADRPVNMPFDAAVTLSGKLYVVNAGSDDVSVLDPATQKGLGHLTVGSNPRGLALAPDSRTLWVDNTLSGTVSVIDTAFDLIVATIKTTTIPLPPKVLNGKILFHTSARITLARQQWISCAACHFDGGADGRTWLFRDGPRNTPALFGVGQTLPMHWSGDLDELQDVEQTIRVVQAGIGLVEGDLHCDPTCDKGLPNAGRSSDLDDLALFMRTLVSPRFTASIDRAAASRGLATFNTAGCASCHPPPLFTDGQKHDVGTGVSLLEKKGATFNTPSLRGVYDTAPYFHDGSAATLLDVLARHAPGVAASARQDLIEFLRSIPFPQGRRRAG